MKPKSKSETRRLAVQKDPVEEWLRTPVHGINELGHALLVACKIIRRQHEALKEIHRLSHGVKIKHTGEKSPTQGLDVLFAAANALADVELIVKMSLWPEDAQKQYLKRSKFWKDGSDL